MHSHSLGVTWATQILSPKLSEVVPHFLLSLRSAQTRISYEATLREFFEFSFSQNHQFTLIQDISEAIVLAWIGELKQKHSCGNALRVRMVQATVARKISTLSSFLQFAKKRKLIEVNCVELISRPKLKRESKTNAFDPDEVKTILQALTNACQSVQPNDVKNFISAHLRLAVLQTLFSVGMRVQELCSLRISDFEDLPQGSRLHLKTKGGEHHAPILHDHTTAILRNYIQKFRPEGAPDAPLFIRAQDVKGITFLHRSSVFDMVKIASKMAGINKKVSPHSCRATLATLLHNQGIPLGQIQDLLNHKQITTTSLYVKKSKQKEHAAALKIDFL